jgi:ubiquinone/menaquinone biosynthesis C-methylase UbiE/DNA-binding transcriptional ArsR family regulator
MVKTAAQPEMLLAWMDCLADPIRLRLLRLLERHELGVVDLCDILQLPQSTVSRHLKVLADQRWVTGRKQGSTHFYRTILDELDPQARRLWVLAREQTEGWAALQQDQLRLTQRLRSREQDSQSFFAGAAAEWDRLRLELYGDHFATAAMLSLLSADLIVADLGCGTGRVAAELAPYIKQVIGVDNSSAMLKAARKHTAEHKNVDLRRGDLEQLPITDDACDAALLLLALSYVPRPAEVLAEAARILKPGGRLILVDLLPHDRDDFRRQMGQQSLGFSNPIIRELLSNSGFSSVAVRHLPPQSNTKGPALFVATATRLKENINPTARES